MQPRQAQNVICLCWDFDKTLIPGYMQAPLFRRFGVVQEHFWRESNGLAEYYRGHGLARMSMELAYLNHILTYVRSGIFAGLSNAMLRQLGAELQFFPGLPGFFDSLRRRIEQDPKYMPYGIRLEHYIISSGLAEMIRGSQIAPYVDGIWACEFIENPAPPGYHEGAAAEATGRITQIGYVLDDTTKTRALYEINKGVGRLPGVDVNLKMPQEQRRVPFPNMVYIADGQSDVPSFAVVSGYGGKTYAVYDPAAPRAQQVAERLYREGRVDLYGEADFRPGSQTHDRLTAMAVQLADAIVQRQRQAALTRAQQRLPLPEAQPHPEPRPETRPARRRRAR